MDDLNFEELVDGALNGPAEGSNDELTDEDETSKFEMRKLFKPKDRKGLKTPVLSGKKMASDTHGGFPAMDDETAENLLDTNKLDASKLDSRESDAPQTEPEPTDFERIYRRHGLPTAGDEFTVFRLEALFNDEELADLDASARLAAVRAILKSHDVKLDEIFDDAVARRDALDSYDRRFKTKISKAEEKIQEENARLEREIEEFAEPRIEKMHKNEDRLEKMRRTYREWFDLKQGEQARITEIVEPWGGDERLRVTEKVASVPSPDSGQSEVATQPTPAVSAEDVFDGPSELSEASAAEHVTGSWEMGSEAHEDSSAADASSVETELPNERVEADSAAEEITGDFSLQPKLRMPVTPLQGFVAALAILSWLVVGMLGPAQLVELKAPYAIGLSFGVPVLLALIVSSATRQGGRWSTGFFAVLFYVSVISLVAIHLVRPRVFVESLTERPVRYIDEVGLGGQPEETFHRAWGSYAEMIGAQFGIEPAAPEAPAPDAEGGAR